MFFVLFAATYSPAYSQQILDNGAVLKLIKGGLSDDLIVQTINAQPGKYATSPDDLMRLKSAGVSDKVLGAMISKGVVASAPVAFSTSSPAPASINGFTGIDEIGVYYKDKSGQWTQLSPEIINFKSGGVLKSIATNGIVKGDKNGHIPRQNCKARAYPPDRCSHLCRRRCVARGIPVAQTPRELGQS